MDSIQRGRYGDHLTWPWSEESYLAQVLALIKSLDVNRRLVDMNSGGQANKFGLGDVNDQHLYTDPRDVPICFYTIERFITQLHTSKMGAPQSLCTPSMPF